MWNSTIRKLSFNKTTRLVVEGIMIGISLRVAYEIRYDGLVEPFHVMQYWTFLAPVVGGRLLLNYLTGVTRQEWRYISLVDVPPIVGAYLAMPAILLALRYGLPDAPGLALFRIPAAVIVIESLISLFGALGIRTLWRAICERSARKTEQRTRRMLLVGAGSHGTMVAKEMVKHRGIDVVGFLDDDAAKQGAVIVGKPVLGPVKSLSEVVRAKQVDEVLICIPPAGRRNLALHAGRNGSVKTRVIPTVHELSLREAESRPNGRGPTAAVTVSENHPAKASSIRGKTILITGGSGFIGSTLAEKLVEDNRVILLDQSFVNKPIQFASLLDHPNVEVVEGDIVGSNLDLKTLCKEAQIVVHAAAIVGVDRVCSAGRATMETNYVGTSRILQALENNKKLERLLYFSTSEVFGVNSFRVDEDSAPSIGSIAEGRWSYAIAKLAGEHLVKAYSREAGMPVVIVRPFNVFGPRRTGDHAVLRFAASAFGGMPLEVHGDGSQIRSWCYIEDFCEALIAMLERPEAIGQDFNIGNPANTLTIYELAKKVLDCSGMEGAIAFVDNPNPDVSIRVPSLSKAERLLGYRPQYDIDSGLFLAVEWYRNHLEGMDRGTSGVRLLARESA